MTLEWTKTFKKKWMIQNWSDEVAREVKNVFTLETENIVYRQFSVRAIFTPGNRVKFSWTLLSKNHCLDDAEADLVAEVPCSDGTSVRYEINADPLTEETYIEDEPFDYHPRNTGQTFKTSAEGTLEIKLRCTLNAIRTDEMVSYVMKSMAALSEDLEGLVNDKQNSDVKIHTKDKATLFAHKIILQARCPVFASMFGSTFLESSSGIVNVDDISAKTMKNLLKYWYTRTLLASWADHDTIVELTYAAGKYQIQPVLEMLDEFLGRDPKVAFFDVELLKITHQLSLKKAEARILKGIIYKISQAKSGAEILGYFSIPTEKYTDKSVPASQIFKACNDSLCETNDSDATPQDVKLMALSINFGMKNVENKMLKRIIFTVNKILSTDDLFALFDLPKGEQSVDSDSGASNNSD